MIREFNIKPVPGATQVTGRIYTKEMMDKAFLEYQKKIDSNKAIVLFKPSDVLKPLNDIFNENNHQIGIVKSITYETDHYVAKIDLTESSYKMVPLTSYYCSAVLNKKSDKNGFTILSISLIPQR